MVLALIFLVSILGLLPLFYQQFKITPFNTFFSFAHNYVPDYYQYLSWMKDGADGKFLITSRYSPQDFSPPAGGQDRHPVYLFWSMLGWLTGRLTANMAYGYTVARIILALAKMLTLYLFMARILKQSNQRRWAFFLALFLPPFYQLKPLSLILPNITSIDPLQRIFFLPHDSAALICLLLASLKFPKIRPAVILFLMSAVINPAMTLMFLLFWGVGVGITFLQKPSLRKKLFLGGLAIALTSGPIIFYYQKLFQSTLPFSWFFSQQKSVQLTDFKGFLLLAGPALILAFFSLRDFWRQKSYLANLTLSWAILPFLLFPLIGKQLPLSQERLFEMSFFIPLAILSTQTIIKLSRKINPRLILLILIIFATPYFYLSVKNQAETFDRPFFNVYIPRPTLEAFAWLDKNTPDESVVVSSYYTANMIPAFAHNKVFFGHDFVTYQAKQRLLDLDYIYNPGSDPAKIREIFNLYQVKYLLFTPESLRFDSTNLDKLDTKLIFSNGENFIYQVR